MSAQPWQAVLAAIEASTLAETLRTSTTLYPLVSALHIVGIALLVGGIIAVDLRVIGVWRGDGWRDAVRDRAPIAGAGLALALATGLLLFSVRATAYAENPTMLMKWGLIALGLVNIVVFHRMLKQRASLRRSPPASLRAMAAASLVIWIAALFAGRWVAFVE
jgi:hypothetical protein